MYDGPTNADRADWARGAHEAFKASESAEVGIVHFWKTVDHNPQGFDRQVVLGDLLADLHHLADEMGRRFDEAFPEFLAELEIWADAFGVEYAMALGTGKWHYEYEIEEEKEAENGQDTLPAA